MGNRKAIGDATTPDFPIESKRRNPHIRIYDFKNPKLISKESMQILRNVHDSYTNNLVRLFLNKIETNVEVELMDIKEVVIADYISGLENPTAVFLFNIEELGEWAMFQLDPSFCVFTIDKLSGGNKNEFKEKRELTRIEERVFSRLLDQMFKELKQSWAPYFEMTIQNYAYETRSTNIRIMSPNDPGILAVYTFKIDGQMVPMSICYPFNLVKEHISRLSKSEERAKPELMSLTQKKQLEKSVKTISAPVKVILGNTRITIRDLMDLKIGDEIKLDQPINRPMNIMVNDTQKMTGYPGTYDGKIAIKVFDAPKQKNR